ncbi:RNA polymerase subunit sigma-70 [Bacillus pinisoli]|uniref:RNA polymerase subunit sigma-70 n=1 Tax=Bacillus pinisoli TaxID=2901866 RepID=UPI001FF30A94|nr:RNA polymerase subunit sigma-70 [Bacillus pinisoli]
MRFSEKGGQAKGTQHIFGVNFHDFIEKENNTPSMELASEFGLTLREVKQLKKHLGRS